MARFSERSAWLSRHVRIGPRCIPPVSSSDARNALGGGSSGLIGLQSAVDLIAESSSKCPDRLGLGVASGQALGHVSLPGPRTAKLGDGYAVQSGVELTVAAAVESMTHKVARPDRDWSRPVVSRKGRPRAEAPDAGCLGDYLGGAQRTAANELEECPRDRLVNAGRKLTAWSIFGLQRLLPPPVTAPRAQDTDNLARRPCADPTTVTLLAL